MYNWIHKDPRRSPISVFTHVVIGTACIRKPPGTCLPTLTYHCCDCLWLSPCPCQANTHTCFACVQYWNLWGSFCIADQLYCATQEAWICQQKIALVHTEPSAPLLVLPNTLQVRGWGSIKSERPATEMTAAPRCYHMQWSQGGVERSSPSLPREGSDVKCFDPESSSNISSSASNV